MKKRAEIRALSSFRDRSFKLSEDEKKKVLKVVNWEVEYISENISAAVKADIEERFSMLFMI